MQIFEDEEDENGKKVAKHNRQGSITSLEQKSFNIGALFQRQGSETTIHRLKPVISTGSPTDQSARIVPYKKAINYIQVNPNFMTKEQLKNTKVFPMREWLFQKGKNTRTSLDNGLLIPRVYNWKRVIIIINIVLGCILVISFLIAILF